MNVDGFVVSTVVAYAVLRGCGVRPGEAAMGALACAVRVEVDRHPHGLPAAAFARREVP